MPGCFGMAEVLTAALLPVQSVAWSAANKISHIPMTISTSGLTLLRVFLPTWLFSIPASAWIEAKQQLRVRSFSAVRRASSGGRCPSSSRQTMPLPLQEKQELQVPLCMVVTHSQRKKLASTCSWYPYRAVS